jgi:hypothetical protein
MSALPLAIATVIGAFAPVFSRRVFEHAKLLIVGAILAPGKRTITSVLRAMGRSDDESFQNFHRVLNRDQWLPLAASHRLLGLLLDAFVPHGPVKDLLSGTWLGHADFLLRVDSPERPSRWGPWHYEVADTKLARHVKASAVLQICGYVDQLTPLQGEGLVWVRHDLPDGSGHLGGLLLRHEPGKLVDEPKEHLRECGESFRVILRHEDDLVVRLVPLRSNVIDPALPLRRDEPASVEVLDVLEEALVLGRLFRDGDVHQQLPQTEDGGCV